MLVSVRKVSVAYRSATEATPVLRDVDLHVDAGEAVALVGPSGSGKTTLLAVLAGLVDVASGSVSVCGRRLDGMNDEERASFRLHEIGSVFQDLNLVEGLTTMENARLQCDLRKDRDPTIAGRVADVLSRLDIDRHARRFPEEMSGGQRQRTAIARALVATPAVLLVDEPTSALDSVAARLVLDQLRRYVDDGGTVLVATHDDQVAGWADRIVQIADGKIRDANPFVPAGSALPW